MKTLIRWSITFLVLAFFSSCYTGYQMPYFIEESRQKENKYYIPSISSPPLLSKKNEGSLGLNMQGTSDQGSINMQGSYVFADHFGVTGNISSPFRKYRKTVFSRSEVALGYFMPFAKTWHFETYAGAGLGNIKNKHETGNSEMKFRQAFIQPAVSVTNDKNTLQFGFFSRFTLAHFDLTDTSFSNDRERFSAKQIITLTNQPDHLFWEPGLTFRLGWQQFLFTANYTLSAQLSNSDFEREKGVFYLGVITKFSAGKKKTKQQ